MTSFENLYNGNRAALDPAVHPYQFVLMGQIYNNAGGNWVVGPEAATTGSTIFNMGNVHTHSYLGIQADSNDTSDPIAFFDGFNSRSVAIVTANPNSEDPIYAELSHSFQSVGWGGESNDFWGGSANPFSMNGAVYRLYAGTLGRNPDEAGFLGWTQAIANGMPLEQVAFGFVNSLEAGNPTDTEFITNLYHTVLGRAPEDGAVDAWLERMDNGETREQVAIGFTQSLEYIRQSTDNFQNYIATQISKYADSYTAFSGGNGNDTMYANAGGGHLNGGNGNDTLIGSASADMLNGGAGDDDIRTGLGPDRVNAGAGDDIVRVSQDNAIKNIDGGTGNDYLQGGSNDRLEASFGQNTIEVLAGTKGLTIFAGENSANQFNFTAVYEDIGTIQLNLTSGEYKYAAVLDHDGNVIAQIYGDTKDAVKAFTAALNPALDAPDGGFAESGFTNPNEAQALVARLADHSDTIKTKEITAGAQPTDDFGDVAAVPPLMEGDTNTFQYDVSDQMNARLDGDVGIDIDLVGQQDRVQSNDFNIA